MDQDGTLRGGRHKLAQQLEAFPVELRAEGRHTGYVAARAGQTVSKPSLYERFSGKSVQVAVTTRIQHGAVPADSLIACGGIDWRNWIEIGVGDLTWDTSSKRRF